MPGLWLHEMRSIQFSLVVDDFGVKYVGKENALHLLNTIQKYYKCSCNWDGERYYGLTIKWDYEGQKVHLSMLTYVKKALQRFQHPPPHETAKPTTPQHQEDLWGESAVRKTTQQSPTARQSGEEIHARSHGSVFIFGPSSQRHHVNPTQRSHLRTSKPNGINNGKMPPVPRLCSHPRQCDTHLQSKRHDPCHQQRCLLPIRTKSPKSSRQPHVHGRR